jgi:ligand-binding sensor domain-containing protein
MLACLCARAQPYWENYELLTTRQGLPHNTVLSLLQDKEGYLWVGTYNGLCRYDGHSFQTYTDIFGPSHSNNWFHAIETLYEDREGNIWIGSRGGLVSCFNRRSGSFQAYQQAAVANKVQDFYEDKTGRIWVGSKNGTIGVISGDSLRYITAAPYDVVKMAGGRDDKLVVIYSEGFLSYDSLNGWKPYEIQGIPKDTGIYLAIPYKDYWVMHTDLGYLIVDIRNQQVQASINFIFRSRSVYIKPATYHDEINIVEMFELMTFNVQGQRIDSLNISPNAWNNNHEINNCLLKDNTGIVWMGTNTGLFKIDPNRYRFKKYARNNLSYPLEDNYIRGIHAAGNDLWTGNKEGCINHLVYDEARKKYVFKARLPLRINGKEEYQYTINAIMKYGDDILAAGDGGIIYACKKSGSYFETFNKIKKAKGLLGIWALYSDAAGNIWIGTLKDGLYVWDCHKGKTYHYSMADTANRYLDAHSVWNIYKDKNNVVWLGTNNGLYSIKNTADVAKLQLQAYPLKVADGMEVNVWNIVEDKNGSLWLGTTGHGLFQLTAARNKYISYRSLPNQVICGLVTDSANNLWISTVNGLFRYNIADGYFTPYNEEDGLLSNEFNFKAATATPHNMLFFGNKTGMLCFSPNDIVEHVANDVPIRISSLGIAGRDTPAAIYAGTPVVLPHYQNFIDFGFSILDFSKPFSNRYRYQLIGLDKKWHEATHERPSATYTNLPPGDYRFVVYGSVDGQHWGKTPASFSFTIMPAFWQTWIFAFVIIALVLLLAAWLIYRRIRVVIKRENEKHRIEKQIASLELQALQAQMNPHFIFNAINSIQHFILHNDVLAANDYLSRFARLMRLFLESSKNRYISLQRELELLHLYLQLEQLRFDEKFTYDIIVGTGIDINMVNIPPAVIQPFVENAINHGLVQLPGNGRLEISFVTNSNNKIKCIVDDNGIGREKSAEMKAMHPKEHVSRGMQLIEERIKTYNFIDEQDIHIHITDKTPPQQGTRVEITLPVTLQEPK